MFVQLRKHEGDIPLCTFDLGIDIAYNWCYEYDPQAHQEGAQSSHCH